MAETAALLGPLPIEKHEDAHSHHRPFIRGSQFTMVAGLAALTFGAAYYSSGVLQSWSSEAALSDAPEAIKVSVTNKYNAKTGKHPGKLYKFLEYGTVVEPMRPTKLQAEYHNEDSERSIKTATWHVVQRTNLLGGVQVEHHEVENDVTIMFKHLGEYHVALKAVDDTGLVINVSVGGYVCADWYWRFSCMWRCPLTDSSTARGDP